MFSLRGHYTPMTITPALFVALSKPQQNAWKKIQEAQQRWNTARDLLPVMEASAESAPRDDEASAVEAVRAGNPVPPATAENARAAFVEKRREVEALAVICDELEQNFLDALSGEKDQIATDARSNALQIGITAQQQISDLLESLDVLSDVLGLWSWARNEDAAGLPSKSRMRVRFNGQDHSPVELVEAASDLIMKVLPTGQEEREAYWADYNERYTKGPATADGLVIDRAARKEWNR